MAKYISNYSHSSSLHHLPQSWSFQAFQAFQAFSGIDGNDLLGLDESTNQLLCDCMASPDGQKQR